MIVIQGMDMLLIRELYIDAFVDTQSEYYTEQIKGRQYYSSYLWDCLRNKALITEKKAMDFLLDMHSVYLMTDLRLSDRRDADDEHLFGCIYNGDFQELLSIIPGLPEDIYFFDDSMNWTIALTHEYNDRGRRFCLFTQVM